MSTKQVLHSGVVRSNPSNTKTGGGGGGGEKMAAFTGGGGGGGGGGGIKSVRINGVRGLN